jgi:hypothetical protein
MAIDEHLTEFAGRRVVLWEPGEALPDPEEAVCRIAMSWDEEKKGGMWGEKFARFLAEPTSRETQGLVIGAWEEVATGESAQQIVAALTSARDQLPRLKTLFFGDIIREESEISWIKQCDVGPLLVAYPQLEHFAVRGGDELAFGVSRHDHLRTLIVQTGGLTGTVVRAIAAADLPALRHLELWLGTDEYEGDATLEDLAPILSGERFPALDYLGLRDSEMADEVAASVANAPVLERVAVLDLSLGTLGDAGAAALLASPAVARLRKLDIHYHFCSDAMVERLKALPIEVDVDDPQEADEDGGEVYRYVAVGE